MPRLLSPMNSNAKTTKGLDEKGIEGVILYLSAADSAAKKLGRKITVCPWSDGCEEPCLVGAGRGRMSPVQAGRLRKTLMYFNEKSRFLGELTHELGLLSKRATKKGKIATARLDGTSDLGLDRVVAPYFPEIKFYGYTKSEKRITDWLTETDTVPSQNRHYTFSRGATNQEACERVLALGGNVAVPSVLERPETFMGYPTLNGDKHDFRFLDKPGHIVWLTAKGTNDMIRSGINSGFIIA